MGRVRPFTEEDIPQVVDLINGSSQTGDNQLKKRHDFFFDMYFNSPWYDDSLPSLVYKTNEDEIVGFLGVMPRRMSMNGQSIRVANGSHFKVHVHHRSSMAALQLMQRFLSGPQDLSFGDTVNSLSRRIWEGLGGSTSISHSIYWTRVLQPSRYFVCSMKQKYWRLTKLDRIVQPIAAMADTVVSWVPPWDKMSRLKSQYIGEDLDVESLLAYISESSAEAGV